MLNPQSSGNYSALHAMQPVGMGGGGVRKMKCWVRKTRGPPLPSPPACWSGAAFIACKVGLIDFFVREF